jgi:hypothetical protein
VNISEDAFVFLVHQGVAVWFFLLASGDDPAVYEYVEHSPPANQLAPHFSEFLCSKSGSNEPEGMQKPCAHP